MVLQHVSYIVIYGKVLLCVFQSLVLVITSFNVAGVYFIERVSFVKSTLVIAYGEVTG
jgi:NADH:ubiquinone oxidoreductase subunit 6 (subunit J)